MALALLGLSAANARVASGRLRIGGADYPIEGGLTASRGRDVAMALLAGRIVKIGPAGEVLQSPRSDYTKLLLQSWSSCRRAIA